MKGLKLNNIPDDCLVLIYAAGYSQPLSSPPLFYFGQNCLSSSGSKGLIVIEISKGPFLKEEPVNLGKGGATT